MRCCKGLGFSLLLGFTVQGFGAYLFRSCHGRFRVGVCGFRASNSQGFPEVLKAFFFRLLLGRLL